VGQRKVRPHLFLRNGITAALQPLGVETNIPGRQFPPGKLLEFYKLVERGSRFYVRWWEDGAWQRISTGTTDSREAKKFLAQFEAGRGTPAAPEAPTVNTIIDENVVRTIIPRLKAAGAQGIVEYPLNKIVL